MRSELVLQSDLFGWCALPPGFRYQADFVSESEEKDFIQRIGAENLSPFRFQRWTGKRLTETFGWRYDFVTGSVGRAEAIPEYLLSVRERAAAFAHVHARDLEQALLIHYDVGAGIGWHRDRPFFEHVIGISLGAPAPMRFRQRREKGFARMACLLEPRSIYLLSGEARHAWEHSIAPHAAPRWSITFRTLSEKGATKISVAGLRD